MIDLNGGTIIADWEQTGSAYQGVIIVDGQDNVTIRGGRIEYVGTFDFGASYDGMVSGIYATRADYLLVQDMEITGFNRGGILIGVAQPDETNVYCRSPRVISCHCHHNRVVGIGYGATEDGLVEGCHLHWNGHVNDIGTGYGFAGWSTGNPKNTRLSGNVCNDNYRKALDFHSGHNGALIGNLCARNRNDGIYVMGVTGDWTISSNVIDDMLWDGTFTNSSMYGIRVGELKGLGTSPEPVTFTIFENTIRNFRMTNGSAFPIFIAGEGQTGRFDIINNIIHVGKVKKVLECTPKATYPGSYFDIAFDRNCVFCEEALDIPFTIRGGKNRKKSFSHNKIDILAVASFDGIYLYETTSTAGSSLKANGNTFKVPASAWNAAYDPIRVRRVLDERMEGNIVNGARWRDWDGQRFIGWGIGAEPPSAFRLWTVGSIWHSANSGGGESRVSRCAREGLVAPPWMPSAVYETLDELVANDGGKVYALAAGGMSADSTGPIGTGANISDGSCMWKYVGPRAVFRTLPGSSE